MSPSFGLMPRRVWYEKDDADHPDACDVIVEMEDGSYYTAQFVTFSYLHRQMELSYDIGQQLRDVPCVRYVAMETPHILVEDLERDTIEDTIDNLLALDTFESLFTQVLPEEDPMDALPETRTRTAEMAAVVLTEVLMAEGDTVA